MNLANRSYSEKRNFLRMQIDAPVTITSESLPTPILATCKDLSGGGLLVEMSEVLAEGMSVMVEITSSHGHNPILKAQARVTRMKELANQNYLTGFEILQVLDKA